jgi:nucleotide-binding universal stress UspA family protein
MNVHAVFTCRKPVFTSSSQKRVIFVAGIREATPPFRRGLAMYDSILVTLDGSEYAEEVLPHIAFLAKRLDCRVILFTALYIAEQPHGEPPPEAELRTSLAQSGAMGYLNRWANELGRRGVAASVNLAGGPPVDAIVKYVDDQQPGLVAMTTFGHSGPGAWVLGSVTDRVISAVSAPVLLVRPRSVPLPELAPLRRSSSPDRSSLAEAVKIMLRP